MVFFCEKWALYWWEKYLLHQKLSVSGFRGHNYFWFWSRTMRFLGQSIFFRKESILSKVIADKKTAR